MTNNTIDAYIKAGGYKGLAIDQTISDDEIDMKLDAMTASQKMHINADPIYHVLADFVAILDQAYRATGVRRSQAQVQSEALDIMLLTLSKDQQEVSKDYFYTLLKERAHGYRDVPAGFDEKLDAIIERRKKENAEKSDDEKIDDAFAAYLGTLSQTEQLWRNNQRPVAEDLIKRDRLYDIVAEAEHIEATDEEIRAMKQHIADTCAIPLEEIEDALDPAPLAWQIRRDKARQLLLGE